jgi:hypothetical protein
MRILVVPDLHENLNFLKYIMAVEDTATFDHIVLLGDYFDPPATVNPDPAQLQRTAGTIIGFKEILGDKLHLLMGNHDLPYYALRPVCDKGAGRPNDIISHWLGNTTCERAEVINALWDDTFWKQLKGAVLLDGWLFSHAGVHPRWWPTAGKTHIDRYARFDRYWRQAIEEIYEVPEDPIFAAGRARGGEAEVGGPLWLDWNEEFEDDPRLPPQIVGHTRCAQQTQRGRSYCIDLAQAAYVIVENGDVQLNIWPDSRLGREMLDSV